MLCSYFELVDKFFDFLKSGKDTILSSKRKLSKEYLESGVLLMFISLEIAKGACELIEIVIE